MLASKRMFAIELRSLAARDLLELAVDSLLDAADRRKLDPGFDGPYTEAKSKSFSSPHAFLFKTALASASISQLWGAAEPRQFRPARPGNPTGRSISGTRSSFTEIGRGVPLAKRVR